MKGSIMATSTLNAVQVVPRSCALAQGSYARAVTRAAQLLCHLEMDNWELAELTWENTWHSLRGTGPGDDARVTMPQWCQDVREQSGRPFAISTGVLYKRMHDRFRGLPAGERPGWTTAYQLIHPQGRAPARN